MPVSFRVSQARAEPTVYTPRPSNDTRSSPTAELTPHRPSADPPRLPARDATTYELLRGPSLAVDLASSLTSSTKALLAQIDPTTLKDTSPRQLGEILGRAIERLAQGPELPKRTRELSALDELIGAFLFARRAGQLEVCKAIHEHVSPARMSELMSRMRERLPGKILAVVVGAGAMGIGLSKLMGHAIRPGGHRWRDRVLVATPFPHEETSINLRGRFEPGSAAFANVPGVINFAEGPFIEAIPMALVPQALAEAQSVFLMVPSKAMPEVVSKVAPSIPAGTPVVEFTKGVTPAIQLPREYLQSELRRLLKTNPVVTLGGFCPGQHLHEGRKVTLAVSASDLRAADEVTRLLTGSMGRTTSYVELVPDTHPLAIELAGTLKNVVALRVGTESVRAAVAKTRPPRAESALGLIDRIVAGAVSSVEGHSPTGLCEPVRVDARECCTLTFSALLDVVVAARSAKIRNESQAVRWIEKELLARRKDIAPTRNIIVGVIAGLVETWDPSGRQLDLGRILSRLELTMEGVASLEPLESWFSRHGLAMPEALESTYEVFEGCAKEESLPAGPAHTQQLLALGVKR
ncbi:MAG: hypothetical protein HY791_02485 [Deltaproteobacteria bacterium]|nr:hypothetical protein [Deltaproteobacteria bacterium]